MEKNGFVVKAHIKCWTTCNPNRQKETLYPLTAPPPGLFTKLSRLSVLPWCFTVIHIHVNVVMHTCMYEEVTYITTLADRRVRINTF